MQELKERIQREGKVLPGNIVKVDGFLNHRVDCALMARIADEFGRLFDISKVDLVLTAEASGIALAAICAYRWGLPMVFAKKAKSDNIEGGLYQSEIYSYTYKKKVTQILSKEWMTADNHVLIIDDFMANGEAVRGLTELVAQFGILRDGQAAIIHQNHGLSAIKLFLDARYDCLLGFQNFSIGHY